MMRCLNIDWLEVYCIEDSIGYPHDANYFRSQGWTVEERDYGTRLYSQMFTLMSEDGLPFIEVRRDPCANHVENAKSFVPVNAAHIRLSNRTCYYANAAMIMLKFCEQYGFAYQRIYRIDLALDFIRFDSHDQPQVFIDRYLRGVYTKINQCNIRTYGADKWDKRHWNSISWGSKKSAVGTKLYCKSQELREVKDKPYIRQAWAAAGLVHDMRTLAFLTPDGKTIYPEIWRLEFSIQSDNRNWLRCEDFSGPNLKFVSVRNDLAVYATKQSQLDIFASLCEHYFHFKIYEQGVRKDRCKDKILWKFREAESFYKLEHLATASPASTKLQKLRKALEAYQLHVIDPELYQACDVILRHIDHQQVAEAAAHPFDREELTLIRLLMQSQLSKSENSINDDRKALRDIITLSHDLFGELR